MHFVVTTAIESRAGKKETFVKAGTYPVVRLFSNNRVIICLTGNKADRRLAIVGLSQGKLTSEAS